MYKENENSYAEIRSPQARKVSSQSTGHHATRQLRTNVKLIQITKPNGDKSVRRLFFESILRLLLSSVLWGKMDK